MNESSHRNQGRNANVVTTNTMRDGSEVVVRHRNSFMGWVNATRRMGFNPRDVVSSREGMPESSRVGS